METIYQNVSSRPPASAGPISGQQAASAFDAQLPCFSAPARLRPAQIIRSKHGLRASSLAAFQGLHALLGTRFCLPM